MPIHRKVEHVRTSLAAMLLAIAVAAPATAGPAPSRDGKNAASAANITISNFGRVDSGYYRGAQPKGRDYAGLAAFGIKTVINLIGDDPETNEGAMVATAGLKYFHIPMTTHQPPTPAQLDAFLKIVSDPVNQPVYVHCAGGRHRTGVMTAAYRMTLHGWTADQAFKEMKQYQFGADFLHPEFKKFVFTYGAQLAASPAPLPQSR